MAETDKKKENPINNLSRIDGFIKEKRHSVATVLTKYRKNVDELFATLESRRQYLLKEIKEKAEKLEAQEKLAREAQEAIRIATSTPIIEVPVEEKPVIEEPKEEIKVSLENKPEKAPVEENAEDIKEAPVETMADTSTSSQDKSDAYMKAVDAVTSSIFAKPKKPVIEKPVIRVYIPPVEEQRPAKRNNQQGQRPNGGFKGDNGDRAQSQQKPGNPGLSRSAFTAPIAMPQQGGKKKSQDNKDKQSFGLFDDKRLGGSNMSKKQKNRMGVASDGAAIEYDEMTGEVKKIRTRKTGAEKKKGFNVPQAIVIEKAVISDNITVKELSEKIGKTGAEIIKKLFLLGIIKTINDSIDFDTASLVSSELGVELELQHTETSEEKLLALHEDVEQEDSANLVTRPPIVTIMGHVDHGKTSILDYIRKANVASGEAGGITQHIGAYSISLNGAPITFLDTPGHAAFTAMRARGANATDIVVIVVAADDGIMPQTIEAINHSKAAGVSIIVAINKMDRVGADPDRILTQLTEHGILAESWGGDVPVVKVSAKTGMGISELLETILITAEMLELKANPNRTAKGVIVEAKLDKGKGPMATILVQNGTLKVGDYVVAGTVTGKIRAMQDDKGRAVKKAGPSMAVSVLGLHEVPNAGDQLMAVEDEKLMKQVVEERIAKEKASKVNVNKVTLDDLYREISEGKLKNLNIIIKADVQGSVEAIKSSLIELSTDEVKVSVVHGVAGAINESDVMLADTTNSIIIGFNVRPDSNAKALAESKNIDIRLYRVIYDAIDDVTKAIKGLTAPKYKEQYLGKAEVRVLYRISSVGTIAGSMVKDGKIVRNAKVRLIRDNIVIADTAICSLKRMKDDVKEVVAGFECGIGLLNFNDIKEGDIIESFEVVEEN